MGTCWEDGHRSSRRTERAGPRRLVHCVAAVSLVFPVETLAGERPTDCPRKVAGRGGCALRHQPL